MKMSPARAFNSSAQIVMAQQTNELKSIETIKMNEMIESIDRCTMKYCHFLTSSKWMNSSLALTNWIWHPGRLCAYNVYEKLNSMQVKQNKLFLVLPRIRKKMAFLSSAIREIYIVHLKCSNRKPRGMRQVSHYIFFT